MGRKWYGLGLALWLTAGLLCLGGCGMAAGDSAGEGSGAAAAADACGEADTEGDDGGSGENAAGGIRIQEETAVIRTFWPTCRFSIWVSL